MHRPDRSLLLAGPVLLLLAGNAAAQTAAPRPSPQEEARRKLLEQMGLDRKPPAPPKPPQPPPAEPPPSPAPQSGPAGTEAEAAPVVPFSGRVHDSLLGTCRVCHAVGAAAGATRFVLDGQAGHDHAAARRLVDTANPRRSLLLSKATGSQHGGGPTLNASSDAYRRLVQWIEMGAALSARGPTAARAPPGSTVPPTRSPRVRRPVGGAPAATSWPPPAPPAPTVIEAPTAGVPIEAPALLAGAAAPTGEPHPTIRALHAQMQTGCLPCHRAGGPAAKTRYVLSGSLDSDLAASRAFVDVARPAGSVLVVKAAGQPHGGGAIWPPGSAGQKILLAWIEAAAPDRTAVAAGAPASPAGAHASTAGIPASTAGVPASAVGVPTSPAGGPASPAGGPASPAGGPASPAEAWARPASLPTSAATSGAPATHAGGLPLFGNELMLNGRFDLNLERRGFEGNPWGEGSRTALQSYHHFLFLSRQSADDPFTFTAELLNLELYEIAMRLGPRTSRWRLHLRAGKLLVPFGAEPLFHQSYGGHVGFDQRVLPPIWAAEGLAASGSLDAGPVTLSGDLYGVRGHGLRRADAVLNLQSDLSPVEDARPAVGLRLGASVSVLSGYYSAYFNPLGHDRRLFMQALDVSLWRWRRWPVLDRLVLAAGLLRADVSGTGSPGDYYHFASYWLARLYALDWLHLQYRQGLRTLDNKRNLTYDARRAGPEDGSTHHVALGARYRGLSAALSYTLNLEKAAEVDDDLLRLSVTYEF